MPPTLPPRIHTDTHVWEAFRYHSRTFSMAARLLPRRVQMPIATLYLFCRRVDTLADQEVLTIGPDAALEEAELLRHKLDRTLSGYPPDAFLWQQLARVHEEFTLVPEALFELLDGAEWDLEGRSVDTKADLIHYSNLVGGSVGVMMLPFLVRERADVDRLEASARRMGIAMQLTNILRDVGEDLETLQRVYLPMAWIEAQGLRLERLAEGHVPAGYPPLLEAVMAEAEARYASCMDDIGALPFQVRVGIRAAGRMYREIMNEVRARNYDNLTQRAYVPFWRKAALVVRDGYARRKGRLQRAEPARLA